MNKMKNVPEIRFKGYEGEWTTCTLNSFTERIVRKNTNNECSLPLTISAQYGLIDQNEFFNSRIASKDVSRYYLVRKGEFAYNKSTSDGYPFGVVKRLDKYPNGVLSTLYIVFNVNEEKVDSDFLTVYFDTNNWHGHISSCAAEGARNHGLLNISSDDFFKLGVSMPKKESEQKKISKMITTLDSLISKLEQKLEKLRNIKQSLLNQMFVSVNRGGYAPLIRFKGYDDEWKTNELSEVAKRYFVSNQSVHHQNLLSLSYGKIKRKNIKSKKGLLPNSFDTYQIVKNGIIVMRFTDLQNDHKSLRIGLAKEEGIVSPAYTCISVGEENSSAFLYEQLNYYDSVLKQFYKMGDGLRQTLSYKDIERLNVYIPHIEEQENIVFFNTVIETIIGKVSTKLTKLNSVKQSLLQKMFV